MEIITHNSIGHMSSKFDVEDNPNFVPQVHDRLTTGRIGFHKPDTVVRNPPVEGYRRPSSYSCPALSPTLPVKVSVPRTKLRSAKSPTAFTEYAGSIVFQAQATSVVNNLLPPVDNLRMKLLNNVRGEILDVAMVLAEIQGTTTTVTSGLMRIARSMEAVKRRKPENFFYLLTGRRRDNRRPTDKFLRESAGAFLEWKYGIMPTVYDVQGAIKGLDMNADGSLFNNPPLLVARARDVSVTNRTQRVVVSGPGSIGLEADITLRGYAERKARIDYRVSGEGLRGLNRYGLGLGTVATVLYDKTPFSFVLNMAVPIAELIKAWTALAGVDVVGYCETSYQKVEFSGISRIRQMQWNQYMDGSVDDPEVPWTDFRRTAYPYPPMPMPFVRNPVKTGNLASALALFTQLRRPDAK